MSSSARDLRAIANSVLAKELADLVIAGRADSSGKSVADRRTDIAADHQSQDYRIVPAATLRRIAESIDVTVASYNQLLENLAEVRREVPEENLPASWRRAECALANAHRSMSQATDQPT